MLRDILPRVHELRDLIEEPNEISAYFRDFDNSILNDPSGDLKMRVWLKFELEYQRLDKDSWEFLKDEAEVYLTKPDPKGLRGWQQLITILNQARGYIYLVGIGCSKVMFIPRQKRKTHPKKSGKTPDLQGTFRDGRLVLCEVKTLNRSVKEVERFNNKEVGEIKNRLEPGFLETKLKGAINEAKNQLTLYNADQNVRRIVYIIPNFDDLLGEYKTEYYEQIDQHLRDYIDPDLEVVFHNEQGPFFRWIVMENAVVVNETF